MTEYHAEELIALLNLIPHPEGGAFRETYRSAIGYPTDGNRSVCTAIYYLLKAGERAEWHRVAQDEMYHFYAGFPLELLIISPDGEFRKKVLGKNLNNNEEPQILVPASHWQSSHSTGEYTLIGCTVSPGFDYRDFELSSPEKVEEKYPHLSHLF